MILVNAFWRSHMLMLADRDGMDWIGKSACASNQPPSRSRHMAESSLNE